MILMRRAAEAKAGDLLVHKGRHYRIETAEQDGVRGASVFIECEAVDLRGYSPGCRIRMVLFLYPDDPLMLELQPRGEPS